LLNASEETPAITLARHLSSSADSGQEPAEVRSRHRSSQFDLASFGIDVVLFQTVARLMLDAIETHLSVARKHDDQHETGKLYRKL
jgi:hypothetical protein